MWPKTALQVRVILSSWKNVLGGKDRKLSTFPPLITLSPFPTLTTLTTLAIFSRKFPNQLRYAGLDFRIGQSFFGDIADHQGDMLIGDRKFVVQ